MKKIVNPFAHIEGYNCFGCAPNNQFGLKMEFYEEGEFVKSQWEPQTYFVGYGNVLHGGIQSTILDEIASWVVYVKAKTAGVTAELNVRYKNTVYTNKGIITIQAKLKEQNKKFATIHAEILDSNQVLCTQAEVKYFIFPIEIAKQKFHYPDYKDFFEK